MNLTQDEIINICNNVCTKENGCNKSSNECSLLLYIDNLQEKVREFEEEQKEWKCAAEQEVIWRE